MVRVKLVLLVVGGWAACGVFAPARAESGAEYVIQISVDGLGASYLQSMVDKGEAPNFKRLQAEGAWTGNARTDFNFTITLPNHTSMLTGRPVRDQAVKPQAILGHAWTINGDAGERTLHLNRRDYVASAFDVAHDHGLRTGMFVSKDKFVVYDLSYNERSGAPDTTGEDNGRDKIDMFFEAGTPEVIERFVSEMKANPFNYSFVHIRDTDSAGHAHGWGSVEYIAALKAADGYLGKLLEMVDGDERLKGSTAIIISADHGGIGNNHGFNTHPLNFTIPFLVWGAGVVHTDDLYALNSSSRVDPQATSPDYSDRARQPIRNGDGGNLALSLLGLPPIPDSYINALQDLHVK